MSDEEVRNYFFQHHEQKTCGRLRSDQLTGSSALLPRVLQASVPFWKKFLAIVFFLFANFLTGCKNNSAGSTTGDVAVSSTKIISQSTMGIMIVEPDTSDAKWRDVKEERCVADTMVNGDIEPIEPTIVGELAPIIIEDDIICPEQPWIVDSTTRMFDQHGREIKKPGVPPDSTTREIN